MCHPVLCAYVKIYIIQQIDNCTRMNRAQTERYSNNEILNLNDSCFIINDKYFWSGSEMV